MQYEVCHFRLILSSQHVETNADGWPDEVRLSDIKRNFTSTRHGKHGAKIRPKFSQARKGTG